MDKNIPSITPYMVQAIVDYSNDNGYSPYIVVRVDDHCEVPQEFVNPDGTIVLDVSQEAVHAFNLELDHLEFDARFGENNEIAHIYVPMNRILAVFPFELQQMMMQFEVTETKSEKPVQAPSDKEDTQDFKPQFRRIK